MVTKGKERKGKWNKGRKNGKSTENDEWKILNTSPYPHHIRSYRITEYPNTQKQRRRTRSKVRRILNSIWYSIHETELGVFYLKLNLLSKVPQKFTAYIYNAFDCCFSALYSVLCTGSVLCSGLMSLNAIKAFELPIPNFDSIWFIRFA